MPFYCIAALFGVFAFLHSIGYIPFTSAMTRWHFWLSFVSVLVCFSGAATFYWYASRITDTTDTRLGPGGNAACSFVCCRPSNICVDAIVVHRRSRSRTLENARNLVTAAQDSNPIPERELVLATKVGMLSLTICHT
jgi:hypothetical protein